MTADTAPAPAQAKPHGIFPHTLRMEWTKLRTLRSTYGMVLGAVAGAVGFSVLVCAQTAAQWDGMPTQARAQFDPVALSLNGVWLGQLVLAALGVLVVSAEHGTGMIRSTLTATPQRLRVLAAKMLVFAAVTLVVGELIAFASFVGGQAFLATQGIAASPGDDGVLRAVIGAGLYLTASGVFGLAVGALVRNTAGGITATIAALSVVPGLAHRLPGEWGATVAKYVTSNAGQQVMQPQTLPDALSPWVGYLVFWAWIVAITAIAAVFLVRRDA